MMIAKNSWQTPRYQKERCDLCALLPDYLSDGTNGNRIYYRDGAIEQGRAQISWVMEDFLASQRTSKEILQLQSRRLLEQLGRSQQNRLPLLLAPDFALMPVKARQPKTRSHAADGYVVYAMVEGIMPNNNGVGTKILLRNRQELLVLDSTRTLLENLRMTERLAEALKELERLG